MAAIDDPKMTSTEHYQLCRAIYDEAQRMTHLTNNVLDMIRLDAAETTLNRQWYPLDEIIDAAFQVPENLCLVYLDATLINDQPANDHCHH